MIDKLNLALKNLENVSTIVYIMNYHIVYIIHIDVSIDDQLVYVSEEPVSLFSNIKIHVQNELARDDCMMNLWGGA